MKFQTPRLTLREVSFADLTSIHELLSLPETDRFNTMGIPENMEVTAQLILSWLEEIKNKERNAFIFSIILNSTNQFIGLIALYLGKPAYKKGEVWFKTHSQQWNKGYTTEALKCVLKFGFKELKLHRIEAGCAVENIASKRVLEKVGMIQEGLFRANLPIRGQWIDNFEFAILDSDFDKLVHIDNPL
ncbi:MAG TPA: GNAT family protein [Bacteroidia bacterium]|nr:GNAT family protein [Bacteroidia bacterium]